LQPTTPTVLPPIGAGAGPSLGRGGLRSAGGGRRGYRLALVFLGGAFGSSPGSTIGTFAALASRRRIARNQPASVSSPVSSFRRRTSSSSAAYSPSVMR